jgi:hypothetical protein
MAASTIPINRAPVLNLWAVVAERPGFDRDEALTRTVLSSKYSGQDLNPERPRSKRFTTGAKAIGKEAALSPRREQP